MPMPASNRAQVPPKLALDKLRLDEENPRLASLMIYQPSQDDLVRSLWSEMAVDEIALSIAANGYYEDEPVIVTPSFNSKVRRYTVIEGNRRLAAVLLLRDESLRQKAGATGLPLITPSARRSLDEIPVSFRPNRRSVWEYIGFRHVNGTKPWDAFSKAKYVARVHEKYGESLESIASKIGDTHSTVARLYRGFKVLRQGEEMTAFEKEDRVRTRFYFSHLYTAVDYPEFQQYLGITNNRWPRQDPVPKRRLPELEDVLIWLYGSESKDIQPVVKRQAPDLSRLRSVIAKPLALSVLKSGYSLDAAYERSIGDKRRFRDAVFKAKEELQNAKATVTTGYKGEESLLDTMEGSYETAGSILEEMRSKRHAAGGRKAS